MAVGQKIISGENGYLQIRDILKEHKVKKFLLVCPAEFELLFIKPWFDTLDIPFVKFTDFVPNPLYENVVNGVNLFKAEGCDFIVAVGGGSAIDVAKCIKLYVPLDPSQSYLKQKPVDSQIRLMAVPTTAGTGSESTRYAVIYADDVKQSVTHDSIVPDYAVLEPKFLETIPPYIKKAAMLDALCHGIESMWSVNSTEESLEYSKKTISMILAGYEAYLAGDSAAAEKIMLAANYSGRAINITQTTAAHAMSYKLTSLYRIAHGHGVALCLVPLWRFMIDNPQRLSDSRGIAHLNKVFAQLNLLFGAEDSHDCVQRFETLLHKLGLDTFGNDIEILCSSVNSDRLKNNPVDPGAEGIRAIYRQILQKRN